MVKADTLGNDVGRQLFSVAPMMDWTDVYWRQLARMLTKHTWLWTEMVVDSTLIHQHPNNDRFLWFPKEQRPLVLQLGGSEPEKLARAAELALPYGYDEINLNCGCPSDRVAGAGCFGASLMLEPERVAACCAAMGEVLRGTPLTVKCRIGVDDVDAYGDLVRFVKTVSEKGGVDHFIIHARKAHLKGLNPHQNRTIPPLRPHWVFALMRDFPKLSFSINGGVKSAPEVGAILESRVGGHGAEGVMVGRAAYHYPWQVLAVADTAIFNADSNPCQSRRQLLRDYAEFAESVQGCWSSDDPKRQNPNVRTLTVPLLNLFHAEPGNRAWKQTLDKVLRDATSVSEVLDRTLHCLSDEVLDAPPKVPEGMSAAEFLARLEELPLPPADGEDGMGWEAEQSGNGSAPALGAAGGAARTA
eukprot:CAMPEP_0177601644 /NCGR_PEP_ID=MMETSP0419_2-20121207/14388_1 /TAXON_ID=582737 /ORGANISM="Tetraselmis sp., Strain GSL018" /LENGTH=414 /DNA_ID=CAMNT_0019094961 /DNA_START=232 /DNA_END=1476 /DNA_ORIENTATION=+